MSKLFSGWRKELKQPGVIPAFVVLASALILAYICIFELLSSGE